MKKSFRFRVHEQPLCILRVKSEQLIPFEKLRESTWFTYSQTGTEVSVICEESVYERVKHELPLDAEVEGDRLAFGIDSVLDMSMTGVLAGISHILAEHQIPIFVVSTYNTDWILVTRGKMEKARAVLEEQGHSFI